MEKVESSKTRQYPLFDMSSLVEVRSADPEIDSWYEATIVGTPKRKPGHMASSYIVQYKTLRFAPSSKKGKKVKASSSPKMEVCLSLIRPSSPCRPDRNAIFEPFQEVEAYHKDGWRPGVVLKKVDDTDDNGPSNYRVVFPCSREVFLCKAYDLRDKMVWVADDQGYSWKSVDQLCNYARNSKEELYKNTFDVGTRVEVKDNYEACWFVATIVRIIGRTYCLVKYDDSLNHSFEEVVDMTYVRPCPPMDMSKHTKNYKGLDKVGAYRYSQWVSGYVSAVLPNSVYHVGIQKQKKLHRVSIGQAALRVPLIWENGQWGKVYQEMKSPSQQTGKQKATLSISPELLNPKRSRSGRLLLPPINRWQREIVYDEDGSIANIVDIDKLSSISGGASNIQGEESYESLFYSENLQRIHILRLKNPSF